MRVEYSKVTDLKISLCTKCLSLDNTEFALFKVSEYPFKKNTCWKTWKCLYTYFCNISLNVLRPNFFNMYNLPFSRFPDARKVRVKFGPKTTFPTLWAPAPTELQFSIVVFSLICSQPKDKQNRVHNFLQIFF